MRCIDHTDMKCDCKLSSWTLLYRHTATELDSIVDALRQRAECLPRWIERVNAAFDSKMEQKVGMYGRLVRVMLASYFMAQAVGPFSQPKTVV